MLICPLANWLCFFKSLTNVIAKERSDCGNLNPFMPITLSRLKLALFFNPQYNWGLNIIGFVFTLQNRPKSSKSP